MNLKLNSQFEKTESHTQDLTFNYIKQVFEDKKMVFDLKELNLLTEQNKFNNLAFLVSDQNNTESKIVVFQEESFGFWNDKKEFSGSIVKQLNEIFDYLRLVNKRKLISIDYSEQNECWDYPANSLKEIVFNAFCHRDWSLMYTQDIKLEFFKDKVVVFSPGGSVNNLSLEKIKEGEKARRNPNLLKLLQKIGFIEKNNHGIKQIFQEYLSFYLKPDFSTSDETYFVSTLYNRNYVNEKVDIVKFGTDN
ncbi:ATP-binding protein [Mycoplasma procyoni]|uniref:ATP-binding protein n=1 Tax=Mycoplasma procyoni TaxID=568784 RepID=UPI00197B87AD|nr:ATP-binding protein [Mycoplasma procyoni]MBN3534637.1 hypothetical protein [Mycoplasma procyoni]